MINITCINCGLTFAVPEGFHTQRKTDHRDFCCPNGHHQHFVGLTPDEKKARDLGAQLA